MIWITLHKNKFPIVSILSFEFHADELEFKFTNQFLSQGCLWTMFNINIFGLGLVIQSFS